jgi:hypothetical protein
VLLLNLDNGESDNSNFEVSGRRVAKTVGKRKAQKLELVSHDQQKGVATQ